MADYKALVSEWQEILARRRAMGDALSFWTPVLEGWRDWDDRGVTSLGWTGEECGQRWARGMPLLADAEPALAPGSIEDLLGPLMERLAVGSPAAAEALAHFAGAWDEGTIGPAALFPTHEKGGAAVLESEWGLPGHLVSFLAHAGLRPPLEVWFSRVRTLPASGWEHGFCPWCGGMPSYGDLMEDGRRRLSCHLCGGAWIRFARRDSRATWCGSWQRVRRRATSSRHVSRVAATSRASIAASGGTGPLR